ncbi:methionyl-tRNA synthetase [Thermoplasmatales archaeon BRNA1]|nr:methionyl-tRNA synthetase [Thermoplasmatales archaeon BRNA1]
MSKILVNIAWPYSNGPIHLGHVAGSLLPPDIFSRYNRLLGNEVMVVGGSDQHGTPITVTAEKEGVTPEQVADRYHAMNKKAIEDLGIEYSLYSKTHNPVHFEVTQKLFTKLLDNGYIYTKDENEYYCPKCRKFLPDRYVEGTCPNCGATDVRSDQCDSCGTTFEPGDVIDPHCTRCGTRPEVKASTQFFLKLSAFEKPLLDFLADKTYWRANVRAYTQNFLKGGLKDRAITRDMSWGVPIPVEGDEWKEKVIYVWFDAVIGYLSDSIEYCRSIGKPDMWKDFWLDRDCKHYYFIGKDNIPFHSIIWPAILMGQEEGFNLPYDIPANEYLMFNGGKLSKSRKGAVTDAESLIPRDMPHVLEKFDPEEIRYYLSIIMPDTHDAEFSWSDMEQKVNSELVAALGNFYHRTLSFTFKNFGSIPANPSPDRKVTDAINSAMEDAKANLQVCNFKKALQDVMGLAHFANEYFNSCMPWKLIKEDREKCGAALYENLRLVKALAVLAWPYLPRSSEKIWEYMGLPGTIEGCGYGGILEALPAGTAMKEPLPVYGKIDIRVTFPDIFQQAEAEAKKKIEEPKKEEPRFEGPFADFRMLDLRVGQVIRVEDHPNADKLFKLTVDIGEDKPRTICAGLKAFYSADEMLNRKAIVVSNLAPRPLRGIESCGMLLAADDEELGGNSVLLLKPSDPDIPVGTRMNCGLENSSSEIDYKKHFSKVTMKVSRIDGSKLVSPEIAIDPKGCPGRIAAVIDGDRAVPLSDGKGCFATVDDKEIKDGAGVR